MVSARGQKFASKMGFKVGRGSSKLAIARSISRSATVPYVVVPAARKRKHYGQVGPEVKHLDNQLSFTAVSTAHVTSMNDLATGTSSITRVGNKICIKSVEAKIFLTLDNNAAHVGNMHRFAIILDKEPEAGAIAVYSDIYTQANPLSMRNVSNSDRFVVLAVQETTTGFMDVAAGSVGYTMGNGPQCFTLFKNVDIAAKYIGATAAQASMGSNQILFVDISFTTDANVDYNITTRIRYTDE